MIWREDYSTCAPNSHQAGLLDSLFTASFANLTHTGRNTSSVLTKMPITDHLWAQCHSFLPTTVSTFLRPPQLEEKIRQYEKLIILKDEEIDDLKSQNAKLQNQIEDLMAINAVTENFEMVEMAETA